MNPYENLYQALEKEALSPEFKLHAAEVAKNKSKQSAKIRSRIFVDRSDKMRKWDSKGNQTGDFNTTYAQREIAKLIDSKHKALETKRFQQGYDFEQSARNDRRATVVAKANNRIQRAAKVLNK